MPTATKKKTNNQVTFFARSENLTVTRIPEDIEFLGAGQRRQTKGMMYQFVNHMLTVRRGQDVLKDAVDEDGEPAAQDAVEFLLALSETLTPGSPEYFSEYRPAPPDSAPVLSDIIAAIGTRDAEALTRIHDEEVEGHGREDVIDAALSGLKAIDGD